MSAPSYRSSRAGPKSTGRPVSGSGDGPLADVDTWGAATAAAAAVDRTGAVHRHGPTGSVSAVASVTKLATAMAVLLAVEEGATTLDEPAGPPGSTVRHLLAHASGLDFDSPEVLAAPATRRIYSNTGYEMLAGHVEQRSGIAFADYLHEGVLAPLGMTSSELRGSPAKDLWSSVDDLLRLAAEWHDPALLHPDTVATAREVHFDGLDGVVPGWGQKRPSPWGLGPELHGDLSPHWTGTTAPTRTFGHFGASGAMVWIDPDGVRCVAVCDREFGQWAVEAWPGFSDRVRASYS